MTVPNPFIKGRNHTIHTTVPKSWPAEKHVKRTKMFPLINAKKPVQTKRYFYFIPSAAAKVKNGHLASIAYA